MINPSLRRRGSPTAEWILKNPIPGFLLAAAFTAFSYAVLDTGISSFFYRLINSNVALAKVASGIPDLLLPIVLVVTTVCWAGYFYLTRQGIHNTHAHFLKLCGTSVPLAFLVKVVLQYAFGRSNTEAWALYHQLPRFHWFQVGEKHGCFPSGHMTVFTAWTAAFWCCYPRHLRVYLGFLLLLALALVATNHHFLSDVIAGAYVGAIITSLSARAMYFKRSGA